MSEYKTLSNQTIWDLSHKLYGDSSNAVRILRDNPQLGSVTKKIPPGTVVKFDRQLGNDIVDFFSNSDIDPNTGDANALLGSGFDSGFKITAFY